jgi:hypothetical protein
LGAAVGAAVFGRKAKQAVDVGEKVVSLADRIKKGAKAVPTVAAKSAGKTSLLTADITEQMRQDYMAAHNGEQPSASWYVTNVPITMALNAVELGIISKAVPNLPKSFVKEMKRTVSGMSKSHAANAAKRIFEGTKKVVASAGAEAGQESGESLNAFVTTAAEQLGMDDKQTEAIVGSILGAAAGGTARGVAVAPGVAAGTAKDVTVGTAATAAKAIGKGLDTARVAASMKLLNEKDRKVVANLHRVKSKVVAEKTADLESKIDTVSKAETYQDIIADEALQTEAKKIQGELQLTDVDLENPAKLKVLKDKLVSAQKAKQLLLKTELETSRLSAISKKIGKNVKDIAVESAEKAVQFAEDVVPEEAVRKTIVAAITTKEAADAAIEAAKNIRSSTAYGVVEMGLKGGAKRTKTAYNAAQGLELSDLQNVISIVKDVNPELHRRLQRTYDNKKQLFSELGQSNQDLVTEENLSPIIKSAAKAGTLGKQSAVALIDSIIGTTASVISDKDTLAQVKKAFEVYKASGDTTIDETNIGVIEDKLKNATNRLNLEPTKENVGAAASKVVETVKKGAEKVKEKAGPIIKKVDEAAERVADKIDKKLKPRKELVDKKLVSKMQHVAEIVSKAPEEIPPLMKRTANIAAELKTAGYVTQGDLADLAKQFPGLTADAQFYDKLQSEFEPDEETNIITDEDPVMDVTTKPLTAEEKASVKEQLIRCK